MYQVMIVDDEIVSQEINRKYIETCLPEYHVQHICSNGRQALKCFEQSPVDIVLVDIRMPLMNGIELIEELNKRSDDFVPIVISGFAEFEYAKSAMKLGVSHYLLKPLDFKELDRSIRAASYSLASKRKQKTSLDWAEENQEIFFSQLLSGQFQSKEDALSHFNSLHLPFDYETTGGVWLEIGINLSDNQFYESDALVTEVKQILQNLYGAPYSWVLTNTQYKCGYLLMGNHLRPVNFDGVICQIKQLLNIDVSVYKERCFKTLDELSTNEIVITSVPTEFDDIRKKGYHQSIEPSIAKAVAYMNEHYAEDLTREAVAEKVFMSGAHFSRCFKMIMNQSYKDYLTELRMRKAIELLNTDARIQYIARQVGYPNTNRFNINFKSYTSYTPSEYRRDVLKKGLD